MEWSAWTQTANGANKRLVLYVRLRCVSLSITTPGSLLANEFDVRSILHGQVCLAAVNQIRVVHGAMNGCKNLKIHKRIASKNVNICPLRYDLQCETIYKSLTVWPTVWNTSQAFDGLTYLVKLSTRHWRSDLPCETIHTSLKVWPTLWNYPHVIVRLSSKLTYKRIASKIVNICHLQYGLPC